MLYLAVAASALPNAGDLKQPLTAVSAALKRPGIEDRLTEAFKPGLASGDDDLISRPPGNERFDPLPGGGGFGQTLRIVHGCIEVQYGSDLWMMFKAQWSNYRFKPHCGD